MLNDVGNIFSFLNPKPYFFLDAHLFSIPPLFYIYFPRPAEMARAHSPHPTR